MFRSFSRRYTSQAANPNRRLVRTLTPAALAFTAGGSFLYVNQQKHSHDDEERGPSKAPVSSLLRSYAVYTMCSMPILVDSAPSILASLSMIPGIKQITEAIVRRTFFRQFVGGETAQETIEALRELRNEHRGAMLSHSVEVDITEATSNNSDVVTTPLYKRNVDESIRAIEAAADFEDEIQARSGDSRLRRTTVAIKLVSSETNDFSRSL